MFSGKDIEDLGRERGIRAVVKGQDECVVRHLAEVVDGVGAVTDRPGFLFGGVPDEVSGDRVDQLHRRRVADQVAPAAAAGPVSVAVNIVRYPVAVIVWRRYRLQQGGSGTGDRSLSVCSRTTVTMRVITPPPTAGR